MVVGSVMPGSEPSALESAIRAGHRWVRMEGEPREDVELLARRQSTLPTVSPDAPVWEVLEAMVGHTGVRVTGEPIHVITEQSLLRGVAHLVPEIPLPLCHVESVPMSASPEDVLERMRSRQIRHVVLTERGRLTGVVSLRDVALSTPEHDSADDLLRYASPHIVRPGASYREAAELMNRHGVGCVPVVDISEACVGIVTRRDVFARIREARSAATAN